VSMIVPDSIEPHYGYKALQMVDSHLVSPSQYARWPKREPLKAECKRGGGHQQRFGWKLVPAPEGWGGMFWVSASFLTEGGTTTFSWPPNDPPEGYTWIPEEEEHSLGPCQCGIYVVDSVTELQHYMHGPDRVIVYVALWGQVVPGSKGARGQFAYPQRIFAAEQQHDMAVKVGKEYDIPVEVVSFVKEIDE
jgi:hypothetical protein